MHQDSIAIERRSFARLLLAAPLAVAGCRDGRALPTDGTAGAFSYLPGIATREPLVTPKDRRINVAFVINPGVQAIDVAGPWETFQDTYLSPSATEPAFAMFTVSDRADPVRGSGGLSIVPDFTVDNAPLPDIVVVPHFDRPDPMAAGATSGVHQWIKEMHRQTALTMSICTGAFQLAKTGLLNDIPMTTNRLASDNFARTFPEIDLRRGPRFVEAGRIATSAGLSAGIDLALRVVSRCFTADIAQRTATRMEYSSACWRV